jgi:hypothetical protein
MRNALVLFFAMQLTCSGVCSGQIKMHLQDISAKGSPVHVSGDALFEDDVAKTIRFSYRIEGSVANVSSRGLVLMVIHFTGSGLKGPGLDYSYEKDYFFSSDVLEPGKIEVFRSAPLRFGMPTVNGKAMPEDDDTISTPVATAQVIFVQFVDGATWCDAGRGREPLVVSDQTWRELGRLERVLADAGEQALKNELSKSDNLLPCIRSLFESCSNGASSCFADGLRSMIEAARQHESGVKTKATLVDTLYR